MQSKNLLMYQCPRFEKCSAPICPLDEDWGKRIQRGDEKVCFWLTESVKNGGVARLNESLPTNLVEVILRRRPLLSDRHGRIRRVLESASRTASKIDLAERNLAK